MRRILAVIFLTLATCSPAHVDTYDYGTDDTLTLRESEEIHVMELYYENSIKSTSNAGLYVLSRNGITVRVEIEVDDAETVTVTPPEGYVVIPVDPVDVLDGDDFTWIITLPMY